MNPVIMIARNNLHLTKAAVKSALAQDIPVQMILIDNASTDGTTHWIIASCGDAFFWPNGVAQSVARCWNDALGYCFRGASDHALVINNDVELPPNYYRLLLESGEEFISGVGVDNREQLKPADYVPDYSARRPHPSFSAFLIRKSVWDKVGPFDENFKGGYAEDNDLHVRMFRAGINACAIDLPFYHVGSATIKNADPEEAERIGKQADENRAYFKQKYGFDVWSDQYKKETGEIL